MRRRIFVIQEDCKLCDSGYPVILFTHLHNIEEHSVQIPFLFYTKKCNAILCSPVTAQMLSSHAAEVMQIIIVKSSAPSTGY
jgi:hypothetical protein